MNRMNYICKYCLHVFENGEERHTKDGTFCPKCGSEYEEADYCRDCGEISPKSSLWCGICKKCLKTYTENFEFVYQVAKYEGIKKSVEINGLLASLLTDTQIEKILYHYLLIANDGKQDCTEFIKESVNWFMKLIEHEEI